MARVSVQSITALQLKEVRQLKHPPLPVRSTLEMTCLILDASRQPSRQTSPPWDSIQRVIADNSFVTRVLKYDTEEHCDMTSHDVTLNSVDSAEASGGRRGEEHIDTTSEDLQAAPVLVAFLVCKYFGVSARTCEESIGMMRSSSCGFLAKNASRSDLQPLSEPLTFERVYRANRATATLFVWCQTILAHIGALSEPLVGDAGVRSFSCGPAHTRRTTCSATSPPESPTLVRKTPAAASEEPTGKPPAPRSQADAEILFDPEQAPRSTAQATSLTSFLSTQPRTRDKQSASMHASPQATIGKPFLDSEDGGDEPMSLAPPRATVDDGEEITAPAPVEKTAKDTKEDLSAPFAHFHALITFPQGGFQIKWQQEVILQTLSGTWTTRPSLELRLVNFPEPGEDPGIAARRMRVVEQYFVYNGISCSIASDPTPHAGTGGGIACDIVLDGELRQFYLEGSKGDQQDDSSMPELRDMIDWLQENFTRREEGDAVRNFPPLSPE